MRLTERRRALIDKATSGGELPAGYRKCKYLESDGYTAIQTNVIPTRRTYVETDFQAISTFMMGTQVDYNKPKKFLFGIRTDSGQITIRYFNYYYSRNDLTTLIWNVFSKTFCHLTFNKENQTGSSWYCPILKCDNGIDTFTRTVDGKDKEMERPEYGFWLFTGGGAEPSWVGESQYRVKTFKMVEYTTGEIFIDLIPCLDNNGRPCMYDKISKQPFYNVWTEYADTHEFLYKLEDE